MIERYTIDIDEDGAVVVGWPVRGAGTAITREAAILARDTVAASSLTAILAAVRGGQR